MHFVKDGMKNRDNVLFVPMAKCILQECCHILGSDLSNAIFIPHFLNWKLFISLMSNLLLTPLPASPDTVTVLKRDNILLINILKITKLKSVGGEDR